MNYESDIEKYRTTNNKIRFQENFAKHTVKLIRGNMYK